MERPASEIGHQEAGSQVEENLDQQNGAEVAPSEDGEKCRQKRRVAGQPRERGDNMAGIGDAENAILQPVHGNIGVEAGIIDDAGEVQDED